MNWFFIKIFARNISRQGMFPLINITGLAVGLMVVLLICAYIFNEYSFDKSFTHHRRIYRANSEFTTPGREEISSFSVGALASAMKEEIPGVEAAVKISVNPLNVTAGNVPFKIEKFCWADEDFFLLFNTPFIYGTPEEIFAQPGKIALSESQSKIFFGDKNPIGEILMVLNKFPLEVRAVYADFPKNSSLHGNQMVAHLMSSPVHGWIHRIGWDEFSSETYCLLAPGVDAAVVEAGIQQLVERNLTNPFYQIRLQPLDKIHLYSKDFSFNGFFIGNLGDIERVQLFSLLATIILLVACINYMNLSTARAQKRSKEIGISKTVGATRKQIIWRLYAETCMLIFLSFGIAFLLASMLLPFFNQILKQDIQPDIFINAKFLLSMLSVYLLTTFIAASYPALYLSGFAPITVIRQAVFTKGSAHAFVRKGLSVVQFSVAAILIVWVIIIQTQMSFVNNKDKGYNASQVVGITLPNTNRSALDALINEYAAQATVSSAAFVAGFPVSGGNGRPLYKTMAELRELQQRIQQGSKDYQANSVQMRVTAASYEAMDLLQFKLIAGRTLPESQPGDNIMNIVLNRKAVEYLETTPEQVIGTELPVWFDQPVYVCGVVEDFHFQSLHEAVTPYGLFSGGEQRFWHILLRVTEGNLSQQMLTYEEIYKKHFPNDVFEAQFPDLIMEKAYEADRQMGFVVIGFSFLAILVACMGVFGLTAFMAEQRTKEIGIRKVLGANVGSIVRLFTDNYLRLLAVSLVIALPIAWWIGSRYLENFAYRISLAWWILALAALIVIVLTLLTVGYQAIKSAMANPVEAIKTE
jgi:ABC-type antimicrobial peptide transport system permease subunit